jgi:hypothetical protein
MLKKCLSRPVKANIISQNEQAYYLILNEMVSSVFSVLVSFPEDRLASVVLAVEVLQVLDGTTLEAAALAGVEVQHVVLPSVLRNLNKVKTNSN